MTPQFHYTLWILYALIGWKEHALENIRKVAKIKDVMKFNSCRRKDLRNFGMELQRGIDNVGAHFSNWEAELLCVSHREHVFFVCSNQEN